MEKNSTKFKNIIFDMDGTLLYTLEDIADSVNFVLSHFNAAPHPINIYNEIIGSGARDHVQKAFQRLNPPPIDLSDSFVDNAYALYKETYGNNWNKKTKLYDGIDNLLTELELKSIHLAVISNKPDPFLQNVMDFYFNKWHFVKATGALEDFPRKPHPYLVNKMIDDCNFKKEETLFVGDSAIDIETAKNAGIKSCGCLWGFRDYKELSDAGADFIIAHPRELTSFI